MNLLECMIETITVHHSTSVEAALAECVNYDVYGLPVTDDKQRVIGRFSVRNMFVQAGIPAELIKNAHLIGHSIDHMNVSNCQNKAFMQQPVKQVMIEEILHLCPDSQVIKALAMMEQHDTSYLFVVDEHQQYLGMVTRLGIARRILQNGFTH